MSTHTYYITEKHKSVLRCVRFQPAAESPNLCNLWLCQRLGGTTSPFMTNLHVETKMWSDAMFARGGLRGTLKMSWVSSRDPWHFKWDSDQLMGISMWLKFNILKLSLHMMTMMWPDSIFFQWQVKGDWQNQIHSHSLTTDLEYRAVCNSFQCNSN